MRSWPTPIPIEDRLWSRLRIADDLSPNGWSDCWIYTGGLVRGYGNIGVRRNGRSTSVSAHKVAYELVVGKVPDGLVLDHLCRRPSCCNPAHMEPVTIRENIRRGVSANRNKTHCRHGHPFSGENLRIDPSGHRGCRTCDRDKAVAHRRRHLTPAMRDLLWTVAQHKYGWTYVSRHNGGMQVADGLVLRGLVRWSQTKPRDHHQPVIKATETGRAEMARRWPVSPCVLGTYAHQPGGWTPRELCPVMPGVGWEDRCVNPSCPTHGEAGA